MVLHLMMHVFFGALVYSAGFFGGEVLLCTVSKYGCQTQGEPIAVAIVLAGFLTASIVLVGLYVLVLQHIAKKPPLGTILRESPLLVFVCSLTYGIAIVLLFFGITRDFESFFMPYGYWIHTAVASVCFAGYMVTFARRALGI